MDTCLTIGTLFGITIQGQDKPSPNVPTIESLTEDNEAKYAVIKSFMDELANNGYHPKKNLSSYSKQPDGLYHGSTRIIIACSFLIKND